MTADPRDGQDAAPWATNGRAGLRRTDVGTWR